MAAAADEFHAAERSIPPISGVMALEAFVLKVHWGSTGSRETPGLTLEHLTYIRGPMETLDYLELTGDKALKLNLQTGEEALLTSVEIYSYMTRTKSSRIFIAHREVPNENAIEEVEEGEVKACESRQVRVTPPSPHPPAAVSLWKCQSRWNLLENTNQP